MSNDTTTTHAAREAGQIKLPNYRIYDRTGGGVTEDIYAETLDEAIEAGRAWIEAGDWSSDEQHGVYRTIALDCCVREIVRVPDLRSIEALPAVYDVAHVEGQAITLDVDAESLPTLLAGPLSGVIRVTSQDAPREDGSQDVSAELIGHLPMMIDEDATRNGQSYDCSGSYTPEEPKCDADDGEEHDWTADDGAPVGGIRENPGVYSLGGTRMSYRTCCRHCGRYRVETDPGSQRNPGEALRTVRIEDADEASEAWVRSLADA